MMDQYSLFRCLAPKRRWPHVEVGRGHLLHSSPPLQSSVWLMIGIRDLWKYIEQDGGLASVASVGQCDTQPDYHLGILHVDVT